MSERDDAKQLANAILDRHSADPDDDLAVLARNFLRSEERVDKLHGELRHLRELHAFDGTVIGQLREEYLALQSNGIRARAEAIRLLAVVAAADAWLAGHDMHWTDTTSEAEAYRAARKSLEAPA